MVGSWLPGVNRGPCAFTIPSPLRRMPEHASGNRRGDAHGGIAGGTPLAQTAGSRTAAAGVAMEYLIAAIGIVTLLIAIAVRRELAWRRRDLALRQLLDGADALEAQLHDYRARMRLLRSLIEKLPDDGVARAMAKVDADSQVQTALRDVLAHRLWIKQHAATADQIALDSAVSALVRSRDQIAAQLRALDEVGQDLQRAGQGLRSAWEEATAALQEQQQRTDRKPTSPLVELPASPTRH